MVDLEERPCTKCGALTFLICYLGNQLVCVTCFGKVCDAAS